MRKLDWPTIGMAFLWILVILWMLIYHKANASDDLVTVCRDAQSPTQFMFHIPAEWNNPELPSWWALGDGYWMVDDTTIQVDALIEGEVESYGEGFPQWEQDLRVGQALVGSGDYSVIVVGDENTPFCGVPVEPTAMPEPVPTVEYQQPVSQPIVSTGRTCVVKYLENKQIVLVCNG